MSLESKGQNAGEAARFRGAADSPSILVKKMNSLPKFEIWKNIRASYSIEWKRCAGIVDVMQYLTADILEIGGNNCFLL